MTVLAPKKQKFIKVDEDIKSILRDQLAYDGNLVRITGARLDPKTYQRVNKVLTQFGGKWKAGKTQAHVFDACPRQQIAEAIGSGKVLDRKQSYQFFETPEQIARRVIELAEISPSHVVLEPSAGRGALIRAVVAAVPEVGIDAIEIDPTHKDALVGAFSRSKGAGGVLIADFLALEPRAVRDRVVMNPPFTRGQDAEHVMRAFEWLRAGGRLVAIIGEGTVNHDTKQGRAFRHFIEQHLAHEEHIPAGTFAESGTNVATRIIVLVK